MKLITGRTGEKHVRAMDDARIVRLLLGSEDYILPDGNQLEAEIDNVNPTTVHVKNGYLVMQGRQAGIDVSDVEETVTLNSGTLGQNRIDVIYAEYKISNGIESVQLKVKKGTSTSGDPVEPSLDYEDGDIDSGSTHQMKLFRVRWTGYSPAIERVVEPIDVIPFDRAIASAESVTTAATNAITQIEAEVASVQGRISQHWFIENPTMSNVAAYSTYCSTFIITNSTYSYEYGSTDIFAVFVNGLRVPVKDVYIPGGGNTYSLEQYISYLNTNSQFTQSGAAWIYYTSSSTFVILDSTSFVENTDSIYVEIWR